MKKIIKNFSSLQCFVLEISIFKFHADNGFRAGAGVDKLYVDGVRIT